MDLKRLLSGIVGLPLVAILFIFGNVYIIDVFIAIVAMMSMYEYITSGKNKVNIIKSISYISVLLIAFIHVIIHFFSIEIINYGLMFVMPLLVLICASFVIATNMKITIKDAAFTIFGILYIVGFSIYIPVLYGMQNGIILIGFLLIASWGTDIFAYCIGRKFGKHKFSKVSPNKSIEGCIGGIVGAVIIAIVYAIGINYYLNLDISYVYITIITAILSIIGQIGDFTASSIKRYFEVKDFSDLIPGHGGMLDRIDSVIFMAPFAYFLLNLIIK